MVENLESKTEGSMSDEIQEATAIVLRDSSVELGTISARKPAELVTQASDAANALAAVILKQKLFSVIQGKRFVRCEGWTTLAAMMGVLPREVSVVKGEDGGYEATVELVRMSDGMTLTRASAECGMDEKTWASRDAYARRSMAITRATSKACRIAFSWVMVMAGYEATPAEEIPHEPSETLVGGQEPTQGPRRDSAPVTLDSIVPFGKHKGKKVKDAGADYFEYLEAKLAEEDKPHAGTVAFVRAALTAFFPDMRGTKEQRADDKHLETVLAGGAK